MLHTCGSSSAVDSRLARLFAAVVSGQVADAVEVDAEQTADLAERTDMVTGNGVYVVRAVPGEDFVDRCVDPCECVRPDIRRGAHEPLVRVGIELLDRTAKHLHAIPVAEACQA